MFTIMKGDDSGILRISLAEDAAIRNAEVSLDYQGIRRTFAGASAGDALEVSYTAAETAPLSVGVWPATLRIVDRSGSARTLSTDIRIRVTDDPAAVSGGTSVAVATTGLAGVDGIAASYTIADIRRKVNEIVRRLGGTALAALLALALHGEAPDALSARLDELPNDATVVTNAAAFASADDLAAAQGEISTARGEIKSLGETVGGEIKSLREETDDKLDLKADADSVYTATQSDAKFYPKSDGDLWSSWWSGDGFRVTVTNYDVGANSDVAWERLPAASFDYRLAETGDHIRVWNELTRWNRFLGGYGAFTNAVNAAIAGKADRAWGFYDSASGAYSPDDYLQISQPNVIIAAGMAYQKAATASGSYWVLTSTGGQTRLGGTETNGFFRISDADGNAQVEIVRGDRRIVGADASGVEVQQVGDGRTALIVSYAITGDHPTLSMALSLESGSQWFTEDDEAKPATVSWSGRSGAWTATITPKSPTSQLFARAEYAVGGDTYLRSLIPVSIPHLIIGGTKYSLGTATIDGKTVLTLTEAR